MTREEEEEEEEANTKTGRGTTAEAEVGMVSGLAMRQISTRQPVTSAMTDAAAAAAAAGCTSVGEGLVHMEIVEVEAAPAVIRSAAVIPSVVVGTSIRAAAAAVDMGMRMTSEVNVHMLLATLGIGGTCRRAQRPRSPS